MERWEPHIRATYLLRPEHALAQARASEARWLRGEPQGPLDGVPVTIKENIATQGDPTPLGTAAVPLVPAAADAPPAARLREAGAMLAKTTMPDYGMLSSGCRAFTPGAQPLGPEQRPRRQQRRRRGGCRLRPAARGHRHRRLAAPAGQLVRHLRPQAQPGPHPIDPPYTGRAAGPMTRSVQDAALMMQVLASPTRATA
jgi:aspartyl-tRNA(Asn)/glutamyl-tRNA(Gln) amidotransferase subunit A